MKDTATRDGVSKLAGLSFLATALGIPSATIAFFKDEVAALPWWAKAALFGLWGIGHRGPVTVILLALGYANSRKRNSVNSGERYFSAISDTLRSFRR